VPCQIISKSIQRNRKISHLAGPLDQVPDLLLLIIQDVLARIFLFPKEQHTNQFPLRMDTYHCQWHWPSSRSDPDLPVPKEQMMMMMNLGYLMLLLWVYVSRVLCKHPWIRTLTLLFLLWKMLWDQGSGDVVVLAGNGGVHRLELRRDRHHWDHRRQSLGRRWWWSGWRRISCL